MSQKRCWRARGCAACTGFLFAIALTQSCYAFKIDTHVYIAQQVINDLGDGAVTILIDGKPYSFTVDPAIVRAITSNPAYFRMGAIGPDAYPDIIGGQNVIHPGDDAYAGWGTSEWLRHLSSAAITDQELAFSTGFYVHAASDVFAHSYINHYSGNVWLLSDETYVERRHFILESFIASKNPPIRDAAGKDLGSAASTLRTESDELAIPADFLSRTFIFNGTAARHFGDGAPHLPFLYHHEDNLAHTEQEARDIAIEIERVALRYWTGINTNRGEMRKLRTLLNDIRRAVVPVDEIQKASNQIADIRTKFAKIPADVIDAHLKDLVKTYGKYAAERNRFEDAGQKFAAYSDQLKSELASCRSAQRLNDAHCSWTENVTEKVPDPLGVWKSVTKVISHTDPLCAARESGIYQRALKACEAVQRVTSLENQIAKARALRDGLERSVLGLQDDIVRVANEIENIMVTQIDLEHQLLNQGLELVKLSQADIDGVVSFIQAWRQGIKRAGMALSLANGTALVNSITPGQDALEPLKRWLKCYTPVVSGIPYPLIDAACSIGDAKQSVLGSLQKIAKTLAQVDPAAKIAIELVEKFEKEMRQLIENVAVDVLQRVTGQPVEDLLSIIREPGTAQAVTHVFSSGEQYNLRAIPDAAYRVGAEMHLTRDGQFDPDRYAVVNNAIVLSKLSLLGPDQLNKLAMDAGLTGPTLYGPKLFDTSDPKSANILIGAVRSIDGSHQWMERAMPFLRTWTHEQPQLGRYSYLRDWDSNNGFRIWADKEARTLVFRRVFLGPLVPGIDAPDTIGFPPVLLSDYPYQVCATHPFPDENERTHPDVPLDKTCTTTRTTQILNANPDDTREDVAAMISIHARLAETTVAGSALTGPNQWFCVSGTQEAKGMLNFWTFKFYADSRFTSRVSQGERDKASPRKDLSAVSGTYGITGDFLFTTPTGGAFIQTGGHATAIPTLVRRFTLHAQRYWIDQSGDADTLILWNQDGTKLFCGTTEPALLSSLQ